jgi:glycogen debranching enzyme
VRYYGSADSTAWFLVLLASFPEPGLAGELRTAWQAAAGWLERALERGGGLIRHRRRAFRGLVQQGWRDAIDPADPSFGGAGILMPDGAPPEPPLADADTQAVTVAALRATAALSGEEIWRRRAAELAARIAGDFDPETLAIAAGGERVPGAGSQLGWLLWADALPGEARQEAAERLCRPDVLTPWGLRTLSSEHPQYAAHAYHRGGVWPFDSWIGWGGLRAAGRAEEARQLREGVLEAIAELGGAPELFAVEAGGPRRIEIANRVQAWTVGARWALEHEWDGRAAALFD